jgi:hypothetical protein
MKSLLPALQAHLDNGATTLAWCWRLARADGTYLGFTVARPGDPANDGQSLSSSGSSAP